MDDLDTWMKGLGYTLMTIQDNATDEVRPHGFSKPSELNCYIDYDSARQLYAAACEAYEAGKKATTKSSIQHYNNGWTAGHANAIAALQAAIEWPEPYTNVSGAFTDDEVKIRNNTLKDCQAAVTAAAEKLTKGASND